MNYTYLGDSGLKVSELCLGTLTFSREVDEQTSHMLLDCFVDGGGNFVDTADAYNAGASEQILGRWVRTRRRDDLVIATKVRFALDGGPNAEGLSRKRLIPAVDASLRRLQTDHIDLLQVHCWDPGTPLQESLSTLDRLVSVGKVRYLGLSNFLGWQLQKAIDLACHHGWEPIVSLQAQYNLLCRTTEWELTAVCEREGLALMAWAPLGGGWLAGQIRPGAHGPPEGSRIADAEKERPESWSRNDRNRTWRVIEELLAVADQVGRTPAQVALNWLTTQTRPTVIPVVGADTAAHLSDNLGATDWRLDPELRSRLDQASEPEPVYPYDFVNRPDHLR